MGQWSLGGLVLGLVSGLAVAWIVICVSRPRGPAHPLFFPMAGAAILLGPLILYLTFDLDAIVAAFSRHEIALASQLFWFSAGLAHTIVCGVTLVASGFAYIFRSRQDEA